MNVKHLILVAAALVFSAGNCFAQTDFFLSLNDLNSGATNEELVAELAPGASGSIFVYYTTNGPANSDIDTGAFVDIAASGQEVIFTDAEVLNFPITLFGSELAVRWEMPQPAQVSQNSVSGIGALNLFSGEGILESNNGSTFGLIDEGYDAGADAFQYGRIDFEIAPDAVPGTTIDLVLSAGAAGIVNDGLFVPATFSGGTITIELEKVMGDINGDGAVNMGDVGPFVQLIVNREFLDVADVNGDGSVNLFDVRPFVDLLDL